MSTPSYLGEPRIVRLGKFLGEIRSGELYVPRFQRPFVWTDEQRLALLQSIYLGYPIGSVMVWRTQKHQLRTYERLGPVRLPEQDSSKDQIRQYLLDGHQRMTTLFASLGPGLYADEELEQAWKLEDDLRWPIYFDLLDEDPSSNPFRFKRRRAETVPDTWLGLDIMLDSFALGEFKDTLRKGGAERRLVNRVQAVADTLRDYTIPVVPMATEELEQVTTGFKRVNSGGSKMSEVHMVNALTWSTEFDLLERLAELARKLEPEGWGGFDQQMILNVCKARFELDIYKTSAEELARCFKEDPDALEEVLDSIVRAARVLRDTVGVHGPLALPYSYQAVLLADALYRGPPPGEVPLKPIREWFWLTTLTEYFQSMTGSLFRRAQSHVCNLVHGDPCSIPPDLGGAIEPFERFDYRSARSRAMALLLAEQGPLLPAGEPFDAGRHLAEHGNDALVRLVGAAELGPSLFRSPYAAGPENRFLLPSRSGPDLRRALLDTSEQALAIAESHAITEVAMDALTGLDDPDAFLLARRERLRELERARAAEVGLEYIEYP